MLDPRSDVLSQRDLRGPSVSGGPGHQLPGGTTLDRILVATDSSPTSDHAVRFAVALASEHQSEVLFVHVVPTLDVVATTGSDEAGAAVPHEPTEHHLALLEDAAAFARENGVAAKSSLLVGSAAAAILAYAESHDVNMIVVGSRRDGATAGALVGSVSLGVLRASERPLLIVDGEKSITYCGNGSCRDVRMYGDSETDRASGPGPATGDVRRGALTTDRERSYTRTASPVPAPVAHSTSTGPAPHVARSSGAFTTRTSERVAGRFPSLLGLLSGAIRLETVVLAGEDAWAITATIPYEGVILLAEFTTRDSASEWFAIADTLVRP